MVRLVFSILIFFAFAQGGTTGILEGLIKDKETGKPIPGANIIISGIKMGSISSIDGKYIVYNIPVGTYSIRIQLIGYTSMLYENVEIHADLRTKLNISLTASSIELGEIVVKAERPLIQKDIIGTMYMVGGQEIQALPINTFQDALTLKAGTTLEGNVRGGKTAEVLYLVDGIPVQDVLKGGLGADLPNSSIVELSFQTGGFEAEYGNAQSGVVNVVTRSGTNEHTMMVRAYKDDLSPRLHWFKNVQHPGTEENKETEVELSASGPIIKDNVFYFSSFNYYQSGGRWWQDYDNFFSLPIERTMSGFFKVDVNFSPFLKLKTQVLLSDKEWREYEYSWRFNLDGLPAYHRSVYRVASTLTHTLSDESFYNIRLSAYSNTNRSGDAKPVPDPTKIYDYDFFLQYVLNGDKLLWSNTEQKIYTVGADFTQQFAKNTTTLKTGGELNFYKVQTDLIKYEPQKTYFGKPLLFAAPLNYSTSYRFFPKSGGAYIQGKYTVENATISLGFRYDFLNPTARRPAFEYVPIKPNEYRLRLTRYLPSKIKNQFSPRFGISLPYAENGFIFINYGYYFQFPLFDYLFSGLDAVVAQKGVSALIGNPNLEPERTKAWEISVKQVAYENVVVSATYFKKESENLIDSKTFLPSDSKFAGDYGFAEYVNNPYAEASGIELVISRNQGKVFTGEISYTYMEAQGLSENSSQGLLYKQYGFTPPATPFYLSWDQRHTFKASGTIRFPYEINGNAFLHSYSGRPYTYYPTRDGFTPKDPGQVFIPNNERMEGYTNIDIKFSRTFKIDFARTTDLTAFVDVRNLLDKKNV
ncbi:MAG: TonB-dependent receptor [Bacteroidota bacterium]